MYFSYAPFYYETEAEFYALSPSEQFDAIENSNTDRIVNTGIQVQRWLKGKGPDVNEMISDYGLDAMTTPDELYYSIREAENNYASIQEDQRNYRPGY